MKNIIKLIVVIMVATSITSCSEYLDKPEPTDVLAKNSIYSSREGVEAYISGLHRRVRAQYSGVTDGAGIYSMYFARVMKGADIIQGNTWFRFDYAHENREPTYRRTNFTWEFSYDLIKHANTLIEGVQESEALSDVDKDEFVAYARTLRAFFYFQLVLEFNQGYSVDPNAAAPPIYDAPVLEPKGMSTLSEVYDFILADLQYAIDSENFTSARLGKSYLNADVANALKARVLMAMDTRWNEVEAAANAAYGGNVAASLNSAAYGDGFDDISNKEWIWGMEQSADQSAYYHLVPHGMTDHRAQAYYATYIDANFVSEFSTTDVRNTFVNFYSLPAGSWDQFVSHKYAFSFESDVPYIRTAEMILVEAEAMYHQGRETEAHNLLYQLQSNRDPNAVQSSNTGADLLEEILLERRKELYLETGVEWFDAKRLQRPIIRTPNHRVVVELDVNDKRFVLKIPQAEIDANPNIDESVNADR